MYRRKRQERQITFFVLIFFVVLILSVNYISSYKISNFLRSIITPFTDSVNLFFQEHSIIDVLSNKRKLINENKDLKKELDDLRSLYYQNLFLSAENSSLKQMLDFDINHHKKTLRVVSKTPASSYGTILLSLGENDFVNNGSTVTALHDIAIGNIDSHTKNQATVRLFSAYGRSIDVIVGLGENAQSAIANGIGSGNFTLELSKVSEVKVGDPIFAQSAGGRIIAVVGSVESHDADAKILVRARVPVNLSVLRFVNVYE